MARWYPGSAGVFYHKGLPLDTKTFLSRVTARVDEVVISTHRPDKVGGRGIFWNRGSFADLDDAVAAIQSWDAEPNTTVYFGVGVFAGHHTVDKVTGKTKYTRQQVQATEFKALALDLDVGEDKPYADQLSGLAALTDAVAALGLPSPMLISSGKGVHAYWPLVVPLKTAHWVRLSVALRLALESQSVKVDTSKIHDPSMVLRPVGTHHKKQVPWKLVDCLADCPDYDVLDLIPVLKPWLNKAPVAGHKPSSGAPAKPVSAIMAAVLGGNDVVLEAVAKSCAQLGALVASGGLLDAAGTLPEEPLWRASLGMAKHCTDPVQAVIWLAGKHPDFDLDDSLNKMAGWHGSGPTTCAKLDQLCPGVCGACPHNGKIKSPAQLSFTTVSVVQAEPDADGTQAEAVEIPMPKGYVLRPGGIYKEVVTETMVADANGVETAVEHTEFDFVSPYEMHITGVYHDPESNESAFRLLVLYPHLGWREEDHKITVLASLGKEFASFLLNRQIFVKHAGQQERILGFLMDYLSQVQQATPTGTDYVAFGWQIDGSFLCGERVIGSPTGATERRLKGPAQMYATMVGTAGSRDGWIAGMDMLNNKGTETIRAAVLIGMSGVLGKFAGNSTMVLSVYSTKTTTGKSLAMIAANSLIGHPKKLFMNKNDTANALFKVRGVLNQLPCTIDELTTADDEDIVALVYDLSQGREKLSMTRDRELRTPVTWEGPTLITTNISLHQKFESVQSQNDPLKARTMELNHSDRSFVETDETGASHGYRFFDAMEANHGWAMPELVESVIAAGGPADVWRKGEAAFTRKFGFMFEPQERFYRTSIVAGWIMGTIGKSVGLIPFDVDATVKYLLEHVMSFRKEQADSRQDVFDVVGQYLQENNDKLIEVTEEYGSGKENVRHPAPDVAVARVKVVYDKANLVMPGSHIAINSVLFKKWLGRSKDGVDRVIHELRDEAALISARERVTMFKGVKDRNPGQAHCILINAAHPRFIQALSGTSARIQSPVALAVLTGGAA